MKERMHKQMRAIRKYAKSINASVEQACALWVQTGCAERWATQN